MRQVDRPRPNSTSAYGPIANQLLKHLYFDYMSEVFVARKFLRAV